MKQTTSNLMRKMTNLVVLAVAMFIVGCSKDNPVDISGGTSENGNAVINGILYKDGQPVKNASVVIRPALYNIGDTVNQADGMKIKKTETDINGHFSFDSINIGDYCIIGRDNEHNAVMMRCSISKGGTENLLKDTLRPTSQIRGQFNISNFIDHPVATLVAYGGDFIAHSDSAGAILLTDIPSGVWNFYIHFNLYGYVDQTFDNVTIMPDTSIEQQFSVIPHISEYSVVPHMPTLSVVFKDSLFVNDSNGRKKVHLTFNSSDDFQWGNAYSPLHITIEDWYATNNTNKPLIDIIDGSQAKVKALDSAYFEFRWEDIDMRQWMRGVWLLGVINTNSQGNKYFIKVKEIIENETYDKKIGVLNPCAFQIR